MAGKGLFKSLLGVGFLSSIWNDFKDGVIDREDKKYRDKHKKRANKYALAYTKNMDKEIAPGITLRKALEDERKKNKRIVKEPKSTNSNIHSKKKN
jgi:hypothetical protein|tara:strand:+ start:3219 stop:3506 length:288 start_codon:yes stop_codon:yes gene_type:complete